MKEKTGKQSHGYSLSLSLSYLCDCRPSLCLIDIHGARYKAESFICIEGTSPPVLPFILNLCNVNFLLYIGVYIYVMN